MKDPFKAFTDEFSKQGQTSLPEHQVKESKIVALDDERDFFDLLPSVLEMEELAGFHPLFAECALAMTLIMPLSYIALTMPGFRKHRKMIDQAEAKYNPEDPLTPVFEAYFTMWSLFDVEVEKTGKVLADVVRPLKTSLKIDEDKIDLIERMKMSYTGVYLCEEKLEESFKLKEIPSERSIEAILEPGWDKEIEKGDILLIRLIEDILERTYIQLSSPYVVKSTEEDWIEFFVEHRIGEGELFDFEAYRTFMKKGMSPDFWLNYIDSACLSVNDMVVTLEGTPLLPAKGLKNAKRS